MLSNEALTRQGYLCAASPKNFIRYRFLHNEAFQEDSKVKQAFWKKFLACIISAILFCSFVLPSFAANTATAEETTQETIAGYTLEELVTAFQNGDNEVLGSYLNKPLQDAKELLSKTPQPRWKSQWLNPNSDMATHSQITSIALLLYVGDMQNLFGITGSGNYGYKLSEWEIIWRAAAKPDGSFESIVLALADHFYDPDTGTSWNGLSSPTARTRAQQYYVEAVKTYPTNREKAFDNLGRALHFIQDANEPHHAANITTIASGSQHDAFESYAADNFQYSIDRIANSTNTSLYNFCRTNTAGEIVHHAATKAKNYVWVANQPQSNAWIWAADEALQHSMYYSAAMLYKFAKEVHMI